MTNWLRDGAFYLGLSLNVLGCAINVVAVALMLWHGQYDRAGWQALAAGIAGLGAFTLVWARVRLNQMREEHAGAMKVLTAQGEMATRMSAMVTSGPSEVEVEVETFGRKH